MLLDVLPVLDRVLPWGLPGQARDIAGIGLSEPDDTRKAIESLGRKFISIKADLTTTEPVERILAETITVFGHVDILVNNAGIIRRQDAIDFTEDDWDAVLNLNLKSLFFLSQRVARQFVKQKSGGKIINIASMLSYQGGIRVPSYTASKSAVLGLTKALANEWAPHGINVNGIAPGIHGYQQYGSSAGGHKPLRGQF